jgi:hypothetical protein
MSAMSDYLENQIADHIFRGSTFAKPASLFYGLFTAAPSDSGGGTEVTGGSYARVSVSPSNANFNGTHGSTTGASSGTSGNLTNAAAVTFPTPTANWGIVTHWGLFDAASGGNLLFQGPLSTSKTVNNGDAAPSFTAGSFSMTFG